MEEKTHGGEETGLSIQTLLMRIHRLSTHNSSSHAPQKRNRTLPSQQSNHLTSLFLSFLSCEERSLQLSSCSCWWKEGTRSVTLQRLHHSNHRNISSSFRHPQIRKRIRPQRHSSSKHILTTPFLSIRIHQCILIKSNFQQHPSPRLQPTTPSPHSIHSYQYSLHLVKFKSIQFTIHLWQSRTTSSLPYSIWPINYIRLSNTPRITKQPFIQESPSLTPTHQYSLLIFPSPHYSPLYPFPDSSSLMNETITIGWEIVRNTLNNTINVL